MQGLHQLETVILLLAAVLTLTTLAQRLVLPYPILLVIGGLVLAVTPGLPTVTLNPDLVFLVFLPPILWAAAYFTSWREFRQNLRPISLLAVGLVLATTAAVAAVSHAVLPGMGWAEAIALGAIVSPPDAVSATAIGKRLGIPRRVVTILEGESLVNDATALVLYRSAVAAAATGTFSMPDAVLEFLFAGLVGIAAGLVVAQLTRRVLHVTQDSFTQIAVTLVAPYVAWVVAESVHASAVLACVAGGLYLRRHFSEAVGPVTRLQARVVWDLLVFVLNGFIFILIGLELAALRQAVPGGRIGPLLSAAGWVCMAVVFVRLIWVPLAAVLPRWASPALRKCDPMPPWQPLFLIGWTGMRGIVTLAAALALPVATASGAPFPFRAEIILLSFSVILATLVVQGLSLPPLIRLLHLSEDNELEREEMLARRRAASAALERLESLAGQPWARKSQVEQLLSFYGRRVQRFAGSDPVDEDCTDEARASFQRLRQEAIAAEREALIALRNSGVISDEVLHRLEYELDVEAVRLRLGG
ncbi:MAG TPA: Na+/H+ antiporter [Nitrospira sp.]|nr:Na+/H+ antiporter [Nitrospira sp.]